MSDAAVGAHSALELRFLREVERAHRLPRGARQARVRRAGSTTFRDVYYPQFKVVVELDGKAHHDSFEARLRDSRRDRLAAADGELTLRYGWWDVAATACLVARELGGALTSRGWTGAVGRCRKCGEFGAP